MSKGIYSITSPSGKVYIGQSKNIKLRFRNYRSGNTSTQPKIHRSFNKYGVENHIFKVVEECEVDKLDEKEVFYKTLILKEVGNMNKVLFCSLIDGAGGSKSKTTKNKISKALKGRNTPWNTNKKQSAEHIAKRFKNPRLPLSQESKDKIRAARLAGDFKQSESHKEAILKGKCKPILQYTKDDIFIREWRAAAIAARELNLPQPNIHAVCVGKQKSAYGYKWKYKEV